MSYTNLLQETFTVTNIVATFSLNPQSTFFFSPQRYSWIAQNCINTEFRPEKFHSIIMRWRESTDFVTGALATAVGSRLASTSTITAAIFRNGKVVMCGLAALNTQGKCRSKSVAVYNMQSTKVHD